MKSMTPSMASTISTTHPTAPCGGPAGFAFARTGLNFAISAMVASCLMTRLRFAMAAIIAAAGCGAPPMPDIFAQTLAGWRRVATIDTKGAEPLRVAAYEGPGKLEARLYQLATPELALDRAQKWKPAPDTVFFYRDRYFVVIKWQTADRQALQAFVAALQARFDAR
jgi:hypothetical protein